MSYVQRLWRAEIIGMASLAIVSFPIAVFLVLFSDLGPSAPTELHTFLEALIGIFSMGFTPVATFGAPIFAIYLFNPAFRLIYLLGLAALPGFAVSLIFGSELGLGLIPYGLVVALMMCGLARLWPQRPERANT